MEIIAFEDKYLKEIEDINVSTSTHPDKPLEEKKLSEYLYVDYYAQMLDNLRVRFFTYMFRIIFIKERKMEREEIIAAYRKGIELYNNGTLKNL